MARRFDSYAIKRGDNLGDPGFWNRRLEDLDLRLHARELDGDKIDGAVDQLTAVALQRLNDTFTPVINSALTQLANVGAKFEGESLSEVAIDLGEIEFVLTSETRTGWVVTDYVVITSIDEPDKGLVAQVLAYDRVNGILTVDSLASVGSGTFASWKIRVSAPPDIEHGTRTDNPHATTAAQVGAYTIGQADTAIATAVAVEATARTSALSAKAPVASPTFTGTPAGPTAAPGANSTQLATTAFVAAADALKANLASPTFTGTPAAPTPAGGTNSTQLATTAFVQAAIAAFVASSPAALDTLNELAAALGNDASFSATMTTALAGKAAKASNLSDLASVSTARTNLGLAIGADVQAYNAAILGAWTAFTPSYWAPVSGAFTSFSAVGRYRHVGKSVDFQIIAYVDANGSANNGIDVALPVTATSTNCYFVGRESAVVGFDIKAISISTSRVRITKMDYSHPGGNGYVLVFGGTYEAA